MNSYGDPSSARGRANVPGPAGDSGQAAHRPPPGRASVGKASVGGASASPGVPRGAAPVSPGASGSVSAGRARVGRASVSGPEAGGGGGYGGGQSTAGRASVGSASVGSASVGTGGSGPGGSGRGGRGGDGSDAAKKKAKRNKRINIAIAAFAVFIMLAGGGVVFGTYYSTSVVLPDQLPLPQATAVYAADGKNVIAKLGEENRVLITKEQIPQHVQYAVVSAEDRKFYEHSGVDYVGIARAAWNNFTGGSKQGASTITQQYARNAYDGLRDDTYARKVKEAIFASKLTDRYGKPTIMQHYLNTIYFGRGAYGIEAAAKAYFGKSTSQLNVAEGAVLAAVIKQPESQEGGHQGYDPAINLKDAQDRWNYVLDGMVEKGWLPASERPTEYPKFITPKKGDCTAECGVNTPLGNVLNYVKQEMIEKKLCTVENCSEVLKTGGFKITTTIDMKTQKAAEDAAQQSRKGSVLYGQPKNLMAAVVAVDPANGAVLAYYGGDSGAGFDYAGKNTGSNGNPTGGHPPASSFKVYTLAAALANNIALDSHWTAKPFKPEGFANEIQNAGRGSGECPNDGQWCTLEFATLESYNVPFYHVTEKIGPDKVVDMAKAAGISTMWTTPASGQAEAVDLTKKKGDEVAPDPFFNVVGYGQYPVTVLDHANGLATLAARGKYNKAHFIKLVERQNPETGKMEKVGGAQLKPVQRISSQVADAVTSVLKQIPGKNGDSLEGSRPAAGKTGTWQYGDTKNNADAWMVGYTPQIATAVWVGSDDPKQPEIKTKDGTNIGGSNIPADIWKKFMNAALKGKQAESFPEAAPIGDQNAGNGVSPSPAAPPPDNNNNDNDNDNDCPITDPQCQNDDDDIDPTTGPTTEPGPGPG